MPDSEKNDGSVSHRDEYEVGFGKPPIEHRFKPGQSGNPGGRRKATGNILRAIRLDLDEEILITQGKRSRRVSNAEALVRLQINRALSGDWKAFMWVIKLADRTNKIKVPTEAEEQSGVLIMPWEFWQKSEAEQAVDIQREAARRNDLRARGLPYD
jgi:hypothetical protein